MRQLGDGATCALVDPTSDELSELAALFVEDSERSEARPGQLARGVQYPVENHVELELGQNSAPDRDEAFEAVFTQASL